MKYKFDKADFMVDEDIICLLPNIQVVFNSPVYLFKNFSIEFHFLIFHARLLFIKTDLKF